MKGIPEGPPGGFGRKAALIAGAWLYFALNAALHDAACAAWSLKRHYDGWRPISAIRFMGQLGQSSHPDQLWYDPSGLPLVPGLIEVVTTESSRAGGRHAGLPAGEIALYAWPGQPVRPTTQYSGIRWILASEWLPYQPQGFVTPAFPGYVSGHSTFSRAAAEVLTAITGSPFFPGGLATHTAARGVYLAFEHDPSETVVLQWATYFDAADQAGLSRVWGGIHPPADDLAGRWIGAQCGQLAWSMAAGCFDGSISRAPVVIGLRPSSSGGCELHFQTLRGFSCQLQSTPDLLQPFADESGRVFQALDTSSVIFDDMDGSQGPQKFYRLMRH